MRDVTNMPPERGESVSFSRTVLFYPHMTVRQNILFPLVNMKVPKQEALALAQEMAELVHIGDLVEENRISFQAGSNRGCDCQSFGQSGPGFCYWTNHFQILTRGSACKPAKKSAASRETGITTIFVTHDQEEAMSISDEIVVMNEGIKQQMDRPQAVYDLSTCLLPSSWEPRLTSLKPI